ncbi:MAG TPA: glycosyltransferase [Phycisphaerales bacterium]|nr:glycosyltransferase [Phycisphaerales bacterium]
MIGRLLRYFGVRDLSRTGDDAGRVRTISVVTPSYNQAEFLGLCLSSVSSQSVRPVEHLVYDPGSSDASRSIAADADGVTLIAEPDEGQADAVARGMHEAKGDVIAWLNSDDEYADSGVFRSVLDRFNEPDAPDIVYGRAVYVDAAGETTREAYVNRRPATLVEKLSHEVGIVQPTVFLRRRVIEQIGTPDPSLHFAMDYEYWIRAARAGLKFAFVDRVLAKARYYEENKTLGKRGESYAEIATVVERHYGFLDERWARRWAEFEIEGLDGVLKHAGNSESDAEAIDRETARLLSAHNSGYWARQRLSDEGFAPAVRTAEAMRELGLSTDQICKPVEPETPSGNGWLCYTVADQRWAFRSSWVQAQMLRTEEALERIRSARRSETCVIVGNGPSLNETDLSLLDGTDVFCSNYAPLNGELFERATYLAVVNNLVAEQGASDFNRLRGVTKLFPYWLGYCIAPDEDTYFFKSVGKPEFSTDLLKNVSWRHTVSFFHLQLAYGFGYRRVALIGFDHSYRQQSGIKEGAVIEQDSEDQNHFDPRYFKGKKWHAADVDNMEAMYRLAKSAYEADGREIVNATVGGHLELFDRADLAEFLAGDAAIAHGRGERGWTRTRSGSHQHWCSPKPDSGR